MPSKLILLSSQDSFPHEHELLTRFFELGLNRLHVRKPYWTKTQLANWLKQLATTYYSKIVLHDHHSLINDFPLGGLHYNTRNPYQSLSSIPPYSRSISLHKLDELNKIPSDIDYAFLSPIFDSISKKDYKAAFEEKALKEGLINVSIPIFALGGMKASNIPKALSFGFDGVVVLGAVWQKNGLKNI